MKNHIPLMALARETGIDRSNLHKRLLREGIAIIKSPLMTASGPHNVLWVPIRYANELRRYYGLAADNLDHAQLDEV